MPELTKDEIGAIISQQVANARLSDRHDKAGNRTKAIKYFLGDIDEYVPPEANRSKVVDRSVADTISWMLPQITKVFMSSDNMAIAEPVEENDVRWAEQATQGINYTFFKDNPGEQIIYDATWDSLLFSNGIVKTYWDDDPCYSTSFHTGLQLEQVAQLLQPDDWGNEPEVLASEQSMMLVDDGMGGQQQVPVYDLKIKRMTLKGKIEIEVIPPENYLIDPSATGPHEARFQGHRELCTRSDLIEDGYDADIVNGLPAAAAYPTTEAAVRAAWQTEYRSSPDSSTELIEVIEAYVEIDVDGDGEAETIRGIFAGGESGTLLDWEVWEDDLPFDAIACEPVPHRFNGRSVFDKVQDIQDVRTVLMRQFLNNLYASNNPRPFVRGKVANPEALFASAFGQPIFGDANTQVDYLTIPDVAQQALSGLTLMDEVRQVRTGIGRQSMALDPEALQNQSATANQNNKDAAYTQVEQIARNMASGWRRVCRKILRLMHKHQDAPRTIRLRGDKFVPIDPRHWNADMDVTINIGLGTGSRDRDMAMLQQVLGNQIALADRFSAQGAPEEAVSMLPKVVRTMTRIGESAGLKNADEFYPDDVDQMVQRLMEKLQSAAGQPDPKVAMEQAKMQADQQQAQAKMQLEQQKMQADFELRRQQIDAEISLKREQLDAELRLKREQLQAELQLQRELGYANAQAKSAATSSVDLGGQPG